MMRPARVVAAAALALAAMGCDALTGNGGTFTMSLSDETITIGQSGRDTIVVSIARSDYKKPIVLDVDGAAVGMVVALAPKTIPSSASSSEMRLSISGTSAPGTTTLTLRANGDGVPERSVTVDVTVGVTGNFTIGTHGGPAVAAQDGGALVTVLVPRTGGHADSVALGVTGLPTGVTATFSVDKTTSESASLTLVADVGAAVGSYPLTITGSAPALADQSSPLTLSIIAPPATASLTYPFCATDSPVWLGYQNEGYLWQSVSGTNGSFTFAATSRLAVAYTFVTSTYTYVLVEHASRDEFANQTTRSCDGTKSASGTVSGLGFGQSARIAMGGAETQATAIAPGYSLSNVPDKSVDLFATRGTFTSTQFGEPLVTADKWIVRRAQNPPSGTVLTALDFASGEAFDPTTSTLTIDNPIPNEQFYVTAGLGMPTGTFGFTTGSLSPATSRPVQSVPADKIGAGEVMQLVIESQLPDFSSGRYTVRYLSSLGDRTESLPPSLSFPTVSTITSSPRVRFEGTLPVQADYQSLARLLLYQDNGSNDRYFDIYVTKGYLGATPVASWSLVQPDLTAAPGFNPVWMPATLTVFQAEAFDGPLALLYGALPMAGDSYRHAYRLGTLGIVVGPGSALVQRPSARLRTPQYLRR